MRRSLILDATVRFIFDGAIVLSIYLLFAGHNQPGGGFVGGLIAAAAVALRYIAGGLDEVREMLRIQPWTVAAAGLALASGSAIVPMLFGDPPLDQFAFEWHPPVLGDVKFATATVFDAGVYLIVVGLVLMIFVGLGDEPDSEVGHEPPDAVPPGEAP
jgi:multisubunit Na+/H+ antiporter MnhB subunit